MSEHKHQAILRRLSSLIAFAQAKRIKMAFIVEDDKGYLHADWTGGDDWAADAGESLTGAADDALHDKLWEVDKLLEDLFDNEHTN